MSDPFGRAIGDLARGDMFDLPASFGRGRFASAYAHGTQVGLVRSRYRLRGFLADLAYVTTDDAVAVLDNYDPDAEATADLLGVRPDPEPGAAFRAFHFEYEEVHGETLVFRLFSPAVLRRACAGTAWEVTEVRDDDRYYAAVLRKRGAVGGNGERKGDAGG